MDTSVRRATVITPERSSGPPAPVNSQDLAEGGLEILGLLPASSNYTFLARAGGPEGPLAVYKPRRGETPLWDFPAGTLCQRELAAYLVGRAGGWDHVPLTVLRDGPLGPGAVQQFVEHDPARHALNLMADHEAALKQIALFDLVVNNADRKAGHVLAGLDGRIWGVDHGLCFHEEPKLRTVLWDYIGDPLPEQGVRAVERMLAAMEGELGEELRELLLPAEIEELERRARGILAEGVFPPPGGPGRPYPWPPI